MATAVIYKIGMDGDLTSVLPPEIETPLREVLGGDVG